MKHVHHNARRVPAHKELTMVDLSEQLERHATDAWRQARGLDPLPEPEKEPRQAPAPEARTGLGHLTVDVGDGGGLLREQRAAVHAEADAAIASLAGAPALTPEAIATEFEGDNLHGYNARRLVEDEEGKVDGFDFSKPEGPGAVKALRSARTELVGLAQELTRSIERARRDVQADVRLSDQGRRLAHAEAEESALKTIEKKLAELEQRSDRVVEAHRKAQLAIVSGVLESKPAELAFADRQLAVTSFFAATSGLGPRDIADAALEQVVAGVPWAVDLLGALKLRLRDAAGLAELKRVVMLLRHSQSVRALALLDKSDAGKRAAARLALLEKEHRRLKLELRHVRQHRSVPPRLA